MMNKLNENMKNYFLPISLILIISLSRIIPHPYNFTPLIAVGIFSGFYFRQFIIGLFVTIFAMFIGDLYLGFHNTMIFTYIALIVPVALGIFIKHFKFIEVVFTGLISSIGFFLITNFGAWLTLDMYEKNLSGLINSYILAIPFFHNTLISTFLYLLLLKVLFEFFINKKKATKTLI